MANRLFRDKFKSFCNDLIGLQGSFSLTTPVQASILAQGITYTAVALGLLGNGVTITLVAGGTAGAEIVTVVGQAISVSMQTGVSTRTQIKTAIDASVAAAALVTVGVTSGGTAATAAAAVTTTGAVAMVVLSSLSARGISTILHTGTGEITLTLQDSYKELLNCGMTLQAATATDKVPQLKSSDVSSAKTIVVNLLAGATPTNVSADAKMYFSLLLNNSSV